MHMVLGQWLELLLHPHAHTWSSYSFFIHRITANHTQPMHHSNLMICHWLYHPATNMIWKKTLQQKLPELATVYARHLQHTTWTQEFITR
jgi:hypothetical protein